MSVVSPPSLPMVRFRMAFNSYVTNIISPYTGAQETFRPGVGGWIGEVGWSTHNLNYATSKANERFMERWHMMLAGLNNDVTFTIPKNYRPNLADGTTATLNSLTSGTTGLVASITLAGNGATSLVNMDMITIGTRLYMIRSVSGSDYTLIPSVMPRETSPTLEVIAPTVRTQLDAERPAGRSGQFLDVHTYRWREIVVTS